MKIALLKQLVLYVVWFSNLTSLHEGKKKKHTSWIIHEVLFLNCKITHDNMHD